MDRAVVTGASGAVGFGLINALHSAGVEVIAIGRTAPQTDVEFFVNCDLADLNKAENYKTADVFFHLAWNGTYGNDRNDETAQMKNVEYTLDAVRLAHKMGCTAFVGVGSQAEYGIVPYGTKLTPELECNPQNHYGKAKLKACEAARELCGELDIKFNWVRIVSAYGLGDKPYTMIMSTISKFIKGESCDFTPCDQIWDYIFSLDLGRALYLTALNGKNGSVYVAGSGNSKPLKYYVMEIYDAVGNHGAKCNFGAIDYFDNQAMYLCADISKLTCDTGFVPQYSFEEGIKKTIDYYRGLNNE